MTLSCITHLMYPSLAPIYTLAQQKLTIHSLQTVRSPEGGFHLKGQS